MTTFTVTPVDVLAGLTGLVVLLWAWRAGARRARAAREAARASARRVVVLAGCVVGVQWVVITHRPGGWLLLGVLGLPALVASYAVTRALTVTPREVARHRGGGRR